MAYAASRTIAGMFAKSHSGHHSKVEFFEQFILYPGIYAEVPLLFRPYLLQTATPREPAIRLYRTEIVQMHPLAPNFVAYDINSPESEPDLIPVMGMVALVLCEYKTAVQADNQ